MSKMYPKFRSVDEAPGPNEPIWKGIVKIVGIICACGTLVVGGILGIVTLCDHEDKASAASKAERLEKGLIANVESVYDTNGGWQFEKITFEGHTYATSVQRAFTHLESCPCKNVQEEEKP